MALRMNNRTIMMMKMTIEVFKGPRKLVFCDENGTPTMNQTDSRRTRAARELRAHQRSNNPAILLLIEWSYYR